MARVTVEDIKNIPNKFELVILATQRAKNIGSGMPLTIDRDNDKDPVVALREFASNNFEVDSLREAQISSLQKNNKMDEVKEENLHAEAQESFGEATEEYSTNPEDDMFSHDVDFEKENAPDFSNENITEED